MFDRGVYGELILVRGIAAVGGSQTESLGFSFVNKAIGIRAKAGDDRRAGIRAGGNRDAVGVAGIRPESGAAFWP